MICEYCGTEIDRIPEDKCCPGCGAPVRVVQQEESTAIPYGKYPGVGSAIVLYETSLVLETWVGFKKHTAQIAYAEITDVMLVVAESKRKRKLEYLLIRGGDANAPIDPNPARCVLDKHCVTLGLFKPDFFYHLFYVLKYLAPDSAAFTIVGMDADLSQQMALLEAFDFDAFYQQYRLDRSNAGKELRRRFGFTVPEAVTVVNRLFCRKEQEIYDADPLEALRNLNRIVKIKQGKKQDLL